MNWKLITKDLTKQPKNGTYRDWKPLLAEEGFHQCVYCAAHENSMGGIRNFHVEHYRPKSKFGHQENDYSNLFYACPICNTFKSNDWPNDPVEDNSISSYPNPSQVDYSLLFDVDNHRGLIGGRNIAAKYVQEKIFLNRPQLITERRVHFLLSRGLQEIEETKKVLEDVVDNTEYRKLSTVFMNLWADFDRLLKKLYEIPHYQMDDVKKPA
jgi:hypothetical protein